MKAISSDDSVLGTNEAFAVLAVWLAERKILYSNAFFFLSWEELKNLHLQCNTV